jgi:Carboxypeptidase regulatory-like domain
MRHVPLATVVIAALVMPRAMAGAQQAGKAPLTCTVSGQVVTAAEGSPVKSSYVVLMPESAGEDRTTYGARSDDAGRFLVRVVAPGRYRFLATRNGYVDQYYQSQGDDKGAVLGLQPGQVVTDVLFRMTLAAVINGRVNDEDGEPIAHIQVVALRRPTEEEREDDKGPLVFRHRDLRSAGSARTDDRGQYRIFGLRPGEYYLRATDNAEPPRGPVEDEYFIRESLGTEYAPVYYPGVVQRAQAQAVLLRPGDEAQADFSIRHVKTVEVSGYVLGTNGRPATNAFVSLEDTEPGEHDFGRSSEVDTEGKFKFKGVVPGSYVLVAFQPGADNVYSGRARQKIEVDGKNVNSVLLAVGRGISLIGHVRTEGMKPLSFERIGVQLFSVESDSVGESGRVKTDSRFEVANLEDGDYAVYVSGLEAGWFVKSATAGGVDVRVHGLQVEGGRVSGTLDIVVSSASAQLDGSVSENDHPVVGARIRLMPDPETRYNHLLRRRTTTDQGGHFLVADLAPGKYRVIARSPIASGASATSEAQLVSIAEREHKSLQLRIPAKAEQ